VLVGVASEGVADELGGEEDGAAGGDAEDEREGAGDGDGAGVHFLQGAAGAEAGGEGGLENGDAAVGLLEVDDGGAAAGGLDALVHDEVAGLGGEEAEEGGEERELVEDLAAGAETLDGCGVEEEAGGVASGAVEVGDGDGGEAEFGVAGGDIGGEEAEGVLAGGVAAFRLGETGVVMEMDVAHGKRE
jgi:hypothetical protein